MKKIFPVFGLVALVMFSGCKKDDPQPQQNGGSSSNPPQSTTVTEGMFAPGAKIKTIKEDGDVSEMWEWTSDKLTTMTPYENGNAQTAEASHIEYDGSSRMKRVYSNEMEMTFAYSGDKLTAITVNSEGEEMMTATVGPRNNGKISKLTIDMSPEVVGSMLGEMLEENAGDMINGVDAEVLLSWTGDNVNRAVVSVDASIRMTLNQIAQLPFVAPLLEQYAQSLQTILMVYGSREMNLTFHMNDTTLYTYDGKKNPFAGCLFYAMEDFSVLSKENVATEESRHGMSVSLPDELLGLLAAVVPGLSSTMNMPTDNEPPVSYTYEYNSANFPVKRIGGESVTEYIYAE